MARRQHKDVHPGQIYCAEWPEWHVDCAGPNCDDHIVVAEIGEASTLKEATEKGCGGLFDKGWNMIGGKWYCPKCRSR